MLAVAVASAGHRVVGIDVDHHRAEAIKGGRIILHEDGFAERYQRVLAGGDLTASTDMAAIGDPDVIFIIVPTPSVSDGTFSLAFVLESVRSLGPMLRATRKSPVVAVVSTVMPQASAREIIPAIEGVAGRMMGDHLGYAYNPAFIALGDVLRGFINPDLVLIGEIDQASGDVLTAIHRTMVSGGTPVVRMNPVEAELTKLSSNAYETARVAFVNMLLAGCHQTPRADVDAITSALTHRHGKRMFRGATPYGGPCWPRDNKALSFYLESVGAPARLPAAVHASNGDHATYLRDAVINLIPAEAESVLVAGLAYKPGTEVVEESFGLWLFHELQNRTSLDVWGWDPLVEAGDVASLSAAPHKIVQDLGEGLARADVCVVALPHRELLAWNWDEAPSGLLLIDLWRVVDSAASKLASRYVGVGAGQGPTGPEKDGNS